jgi:hypothetical protein
VLALELETAELFIQIGSGRSPSKCLRPAHGLGRDARWQSAGASSGSALTRDKYASTLDQKDRRDRPGGPRCSIALTTSWLSAWVDDDIALGGQIRKQSALMERRLAESESGFATLA